MIKKIVLLLVVSFGLTKRTKAQVITAVSCDWMGLVVNVSDTNIVDIYHSGHYLTHPQEYNFIDWEITDNQGNIIAQDIVIDYNRFAFQPNIPLTDTLNVSAHLINDSALYQGNPVNCLIQDQLYWKEDYYPSGTIYGRWTFVYENVGEDQNNPDSCVANPVDDCLQLIYGILYVDVMVLHINSAYAACNSIYDFTEENVFSGKYICTSNSGVQIFEIGFLGKP